MYAMECTNIGVADLEHREGLAEQRLARLAGEVDDIFGGDTFNIEDLF